MITSVGYVTANFKIIETRLDSKWPKEEQVLSRGTPVYQALAGSFRPDPIRTLSEDQAEDLERLAARYRDITRPKRPQTGYPGEPPRNGTPPSQ